MSQFSQELYKLEPSNMSDCIVGLTLGFMIYSAILAILLSFPIFHANIKN